MIWPPLKAWTSKSYIGGQVHFVAINYGGNLMGRWVILMSVLDSEVVVKVSFSQLIDSSNWETGWDGVVHSNSCESINNTSEIITSHNVYPTIDSGLTIPITKEFIRPWFGSN